MRMEVKLFTLKMSLFGTGRFSIDAAAKMNNAYSNKSAYLFKEARARD